MNSKLNDVAERGGRVVNVLWVPERENPADPSKPFWSKYVVVAEFGAVAAAAPIPKARARKA
ncbi:hypothetical protein ACFSCV_03015 [Methylopila henanensis]|uniref:Uncharacterized protein n=1 Tax=Methylopila henanensis TaxID=873516 RepID=A0ABW4K4W8_9HYPH